MVALLRSTASICLRNKCSLCLGLERTIQMTRATSGRATRYDRIVIAVSGSNWWPAGTSTTTCRSNMQMRSLLAYKFGVG